MTFRVLFFADQLLLNEVKNIISSNKKGDLDFENEIWITATSILALHAWVESCLNLVAIQMSDKISFQEYERLWIVDKLNFLYDSRGIKANWSSAPLQDVEWLIQYRNWLTHYKLPHIWLTWSFWYLKEDWIGTSKLKPENLNLILLKRYYSNSLLSLKNVILLLELRDDFEYLFTEDFKLMLVW